MPPVVAAAIVTAAGLTGMTATLVSAAITIAGSMAISSLTAKPRGSALAASERGQMIRSATAARRVVYGRARVSGPIAFAHTTNSHTGVRNAVLHMVLPLAGHEIDEVEGIYVNEERFDGVVGAQGWRVPAARGRFSNGAFNDGVRNSVNLVQYRVGSGTADQLADPFLLRDVSVWSSAHRLRGIAYLYARLFWDRNEFAAGLPNLSAVLRGRKVFDPRTGQSGWNDNPALCIRDYLTAPWGMAASAEELDDDSFIAAAHLCDELVSVATGGTQKRYTCNGVLALDAKPIEIMEQLLASCAGTLVYTQGRYRLYPAAARPAYRTLDASCLRGPVVVRPLPPRRERVNTVQGTFVDPTRGYVAATFAPVTSAIYRAEDGGERLGRDLELGFTNNAFTAQRLARLQLERLRKGLTLELPCTLAALDVAVMQPVRVTLPELGFTDKLFLPTEWTLSPEGGVDLVLQEEEASLYSWDGGSASEDAPAVTLPALTPSVPLLTVRESVQVGGPVLLVSLAPQPEALHSRYEVEIREAGSESWRSAGSGDELTISDVRAGQSYELRARALNVYGAASVWTQVSVQVLGGTAPPGDVVALSGSVLDGTVYLSWPAASGLISHYRLRWTAQTAGAVWSNAVDVDTQVTGLRAALPARPGTYLLKAVDALGRESEAAASFTTTMPASSASVGVATLAQHPAFAGAKTNCSVNGSGQLSIDSLSAFDAQSVSFDTLAGSFDSAGGGAQAEGIYEFASVHDLGARYLVRLTAQLQATVIDLVTDLDAATGNFDSREGSFDGSAPSAVDVLVEVSTTSDNPSGATTWSSWQAVGMTEVQARGLKLRARLLTRNPMATPALEQLTVTLEMAERVSGGSVAASSTSGDSITFAPAFRLTPAITVTPSNAASGDYAVITAQSRSGFSVIFRNSAGTAVSRAYDWLARGHGREG